MNDEAYEVHTCDCTHRYESGRVMNWVCAWQIWSREGPGLLELEISGRSSEFRVILGESSVGKFLFIPSLEKGCVLSWDLQDYFWNLSHLCRQINTTDAVTIISAVRAYGKYLERQEEDISVEIDESDVSEAERLSSNDDDDSREE